MTFKKWLCARYNRISHPFARIQKKQWWEKKWSQNDCPRERGTREISREIIAAVDTGWFPAEGTALDIGCGLGEIAAWFVQRGYSAVGFDIAKSAAMKARDKHKHMVLQPLFVTRDITAKTPPNRQYNILVDRGCLHQISKNLVSEYVRNVSAVAAPDARFLLYVKAYRKGVPYGDPIDREKQVAWVQAAFEGTFAIERYADTQMDRQGGNNPETARPAVVFWMRRTPASKSP